LRDQSGTPYDITALAGIPDRDCRHGTWFGSAVRERFVSLNVPLNPEHTRINYLKSSCLNIWILLV